MAAYLLDTHVFIWIDSEPGRLSEVVKEIISNEAHEIFLSVVSLWEIQIKRQLGKISLSIPLQDLVDSQTRTNRISLLPIKPEHVLYLDRLPDLHKDPFDRMLVAQSCVEQVALVTHDPVLRNYPAKIIW